MIPVTVNDIEMNTGIPDSDGSLWYVDGIDGWDSPALRQSTLEPTSKHGSILTETLLGTRAVTVSGLCKCHGTSGYWASKNHLLGSTSGLGVAFDLRVEEDVIKRLGVVRGGEVRITYFPGNFRFEIPLLAPDPLKYAVATSIVDIPGGEGTEVVVSTGTFATFPTITTSGLVNIENFSVGLTLRTMEAAPDDTVFDMHERTVYSDDVNNYGLLSPLSFWWSLQPGENEIRNHGTEDASMTYHDAWV